MTSLEMMKATAKPGFWFVNTAPLGDDPVWELQRAPYYDPLVDSKLFGYDAKQFMARQYR